MALGNRVHPIIPHNIKQPPQDKGTRAQKTKWNAHSNRARNTARSSIKAKCEPQLPVQGHRRSFTSLCLFNYLTFFSVATEKNEILKAEFLRHLRSCALLIPRGLGQHQVCSLVIRDCDIKVTAHSWDRFIFVLGHSFLALLVLILMHSLSETKIPTTSWQTENNNDQILKPASWTHRLGTIWEQLLKARAWV